MTRAKTHLPGVRKLKKIKELFVGFSFWQEDKEKGANISSLAQSIGNIGNVQKRRVIVGFDVSCHGEFLARLSVCCLLGLGVSCFFV